MSGRSRVAKHIRSYYTRESQADTAEDDIFRCKDCQAIVNLGNDTGKLYSHILMHYEKLKESIQSHGKKTDPNDSQVSAPSESAATKVSPTSKSGAENIESGSGEAERKKLHSLFVIMTETIQSIKEQVNNLKDTISSIESQLNTPSDRDEQSDEIVVLKVIRKTTSEVAPSNAK